ncbi:MAG: regulatory protein RecX [Candidatus Dormibacteria bacterium]
MRDAGAAQRQGVPAAPADPDSAAAAEAVALRMLRGAAQSAAALQRRLQRRGFSEPAAVAATAAMVRLRYVDDAALAGSIAARGQRSGHGRIQVAAQLRARGVGDEAIAATLADVDAQGERTAALHLGRRLWLRAKPEWDGHQRRQRVGGALQRRGFDSETVNWVLGELEREV